MKNHAKFRSRKYILNNLNKLTNQMQQVYKFIT